MSKVILGLDLFAGGGGCSRGYLDAFERAGLPLRMYGIDSWPQPRYPKSGGSVFIKGNAMRYLADESFIRHFDFVHMSPPCQFFSPTRTMKKNLQKEHIDYLTPALKMVREKYRDMLWITENVPEAPMYTRHHQVLRLCASSFPGHSGFDERRLLHRHRNFRLHNFSVPRLPCNHNGFKPKGVYGSLNSDVPGGAEVAENMAEAEKLMGIDWMKWDELKEAIPPAFTDYIGASAGGLIEVLG